MTVLLIAEHDETRIADATVRALSAALLLGEVHVLVAGVAAGAAAQDAATLRGVSKVLHADAPYFAGQLAEPLAALVQSLAGGYGQIAAAATSVGKNMLPRAAALLGAPQISDAIAVVDGRTFRRPIYAGNAIQTIAAPEGVFALTIRPTMFAAAERDGDAPIETVTAPNDPGLSRHVEDRVVASTRPDLGSARVVVSGGRAFGSKAEFDRLVGPLADRLRGAVGASRAAVDSGYAPSECQVGQTGRIVAPELYIACGISGAIQHLAGMKDARVVVAINKDADAPIFKVADYGLVADVFTALPELTSALN